MINLFRTIRRKLIGKENIGRYLLYAAGEILLVVIGILIAVQVNNWNENRIERNLEQRYLHRLSADLEKDIQQISASMSANLNRKERAEFLLATTDSPALIESQPTYFIMSIEYAGYTNDPVITDHTYEEIKSSGNLAIIQNETIRTALSVYYSAVSNRAQYNFIRQDFQLKYLEYQRGILSAEQQINMGSFRTSEEYTAEDAMEVYRKMMNKTEFIEWLPYTIQSKVRTSETLMAFHQQASTIRELIETYLAEF